MTRRGLLAAFLVFTATPLVAQTDSKSVFQMAAREPAGSQRAIDLYARYVRLEPSDAWGFLALAEAHAAAREFDRAFAALARAEQLAPEEEDVAIVRTRVKRAHRDAMPSLKPISYFTRDTDGNSALRVGASGDVSISQAARAGFLAAHTLISDGVTDASADQASASLLVKTATVRWNSEAGVARVASTRTLNTPVVQTHLRWANAARGPVVDVRVRHAPLTSAYALVQAEARLTEARAVVDLPLGGFKLRGSGQLGSITTLAEEVVVTPGPSGPGNPTRNPGAGRSATSSNQRVGFGGGIVRALSAAAEVSMSAHRLGYAEPSASGYFAPEHVDQVELAAYAEIYRFEPITISFDAGAGVQRAKLFGQPTGDVTPAARFWGMLSAPLSERLELNLEVDAYKSQLSTVATSASWASMAGGISLRFLID